MHKAAPTAVIKKLKKKKQLGAKKIRLNCFLRMMIIQMQAFIIYESYKEA